MDVEFVRQDFDLEPFARRFFSPQETASLHALPQDQQVAAFFACWTRKEAYLKARGDGLTLALDSFDVSLEPGEPARLRAVQGDAQEAGRWSLAHLVPKPGFVGALALEGAGWRLGCWQWVQDEPNWERDGLA